MPIDQRVYGGTSQIVPVELTHIFIPCSAVVHPPVEPTNVTDVKIYGGDTFIGMHSQQWGVINSAVLDGQAYYDAYGTQEVILYTRLC